MERNHPRYFRSFIREEIRFSWRRNLISHLYLLKSGRRCIGGCLSVHRYVSGEMAENFHWTMFYNALDNKFDVSYNFIPNVSSKQALSVIVILIISRFSMFFFYSLSLSLSFFLFSSSLSLSLFFNIAIERSLFTRNRCNDK